MFCPGRFESTEDREFYKPGGFHPVNIGDTFKNYRVIHKLGHGGFATIWLARDSERDRNVALKIVAAQASNTCAEVEILQYLATQTHSEHADNSHISLLLDHFWIKGPNGCHICLVFEALGPSVAQLRTDNVALRINQAQKVGVQASQGLAYLHSVGIGHGDFTTGNILCHVNGIDSWSEKEVYERLGEPKLDPLVLATGEPYTGLNGPSALVERAELSELLERYSPEILSISIIDFGQAFRLADVEVHEVGTPEEYCAPELLFGRRATALSDIWALGCCLFEIRGSEQLFESFGGGRNPIGITRQIVQMFGKLPEPLWTEWDVERRQLFDEDGEPRTDWDHGIALAVKFPLEEAIQDIGTGEKYGTNAAGESSLCSTSCWELLQPPPRVAGVEARDLADLLLKMLKLKPEERMQAEAVLEHVWFTSNY